MFTALTSQLAAVLKRVTGRGVLSEQDVTEALRDIRRHLLEADVSFEVTQGFVERVRERAVAAIALKTVSPGQQVVKLVRDEIARMLGPSNQHLARRPSAPRAGRKARARRPPPPDWRDAPSTSTRCRGWSPPI